MHSYLNPRYVYVQTPHSNAGDEQTRHEREEHEIEIREEEDDTKKILKESSNISRINEKRVRYERARHTVGKYVCKGDFFKKHKWALNQNNEYLE